jgi:hypothetical protein
MVIDNNELQELIRIILPSMDSMVRLIFNSSFRAAIITDTVIVGLIEWLGSEIKDQPLRIHKTRIAYTQAKMINK